jgi:membrane-bound lytic murein transglycosylase D
MKKRLILLVFIALLAFCGGAVFRTTSASGTGEGLKPIFRDFALPKALSICGEPMPLDNQAVLERLDRELTFSAWDQAQVFMWIKRSGRYFPILEQKLRQTGMPDDLKYVAVAESSLVTNVRSSAGALGPWQFMAQTGQKHGLLKDQWVDERLNFELSTDAALRYLQNLKEMFGSWALALAAYNGGEIRIKKEIEEQKVKDFYRLVLSGETERFIFRIGAIKLILENPERYGYIVDKARVYKPIDSDAVPVNIQTPIHIAEVALALGTDFKAIKELNPQILGYELPPGSYTLRVPVGLGVKTAELLKEPSLTPHKGENMLSETYYVVRPGDSLARISNKTGIPVDVLRRINGIQGSHITVGQKLRLNS